MLHQEIIMTSRSIETIGWLGATLILGSYGLLSLGIISGSSLIYHALVLAGSIGVAAISYRKKARQPMILNVIFAFFALIAIARIIIISA